MSILAVLGIALGAGLFVELLQLPGHAHDHEHQHGPHDDLEQVRQALATNEESV